MKWHGMAWHEICQYPSTLILKFERNTRMHSGPLYVANVFDWYIITPGRHIWTMLSSNTCMSEFAIEGACFSSPPVLSRSRWKPKKPRDGLPSAPKVTPLAWRSLMPPCRNAWRAFLGLALFSPTVVFLVGKGCSGGRWEADVIVPRCRSPAK